MVELALVLPVLLLVVLAIVDFGRAIDYKNAENHIANLAARYGAIGILPTTGPCANKASLSAYINCEVTADAPELNGGGGTGPQGLTICISMGSNSSQAKVGDPITVKLTDPFRWIPVPALGGAFQFTATPLTGSATMMLENTAQTAWATSPTPC
jgi:hypothetical protein